MIAVARILDAVDRDRLVAVGEAHAQAHAALEVGRDEAGDRRRDRQLDGLLGLEPDARRDRLDGDDRAHAVALGREHRGRDAGTEDRDEEGDGEQPEAPQGRREVSERHAGMVTE